MTAFFSELASALAIGEGGRSYADYCESAEFPTKTHLDPSVMPREWHHMPHRPKLMTDGPGRFPIFYHACTDTIFHLNPVWLHRDTPVLALWYHELAHSTGHSTRVARPWLVSLEQPLPSYDMLCWAQEELVAELTAGYMMEQLGVDTREQVLEYCTYMLRFFDRAEKNRAIVGAIPQAQDAVQYLRQFS
jgi:hypothetical protein